MSLEARWSRRLLIAGLATQLIGALDPLEGSLVIAAGSAMAAFAAGSSHTSHRRPILWSFALTSVGAAAIWGLSALGGVGGNSGHSWAWVILIVPYPIGWMLGIRTGIRALRDHAPAAGAR